MYTLPDHPQSMRLTRGMLLAALVAGSSALCACHRPLNQSNQLLGTTPLPALEPRMPNEIAQTDAEDVAGTSIAPLDRSDYTMLTVLITPEQVEHEPTYRTHAPLIPSSARSKNAWPTPRSAVSTSVDDGAAALDGLVEPFRPVVELVIAPVALIVNPPWSIERGPSGSVPLLPDQQHATPWRWVETPEQEPDVVQSR